MRHSGVARMSKLRKHSMGTLMSVVNYYVVVNHSTVYGTIIYMYRLLRTQYYVSECSTVVSRKYAPPFCNLSLSTNRRGGGEGGLIRGMRHFLPRLRPPSIEKCLVVLWMLSSFLRCHFTTETLNLTVGVSTGGGRLMCEIKIPLQDFALKMQGGLMREGGGAYMRDTTV